MAQLLDHIDYLSKEIGARPAGTEEEQQAALYIADQLQHEAGFHAEIEEFTSSSNLEGARAIPCVVIVLVVVLAMIFNVLTIPALILTLLAGAVYALEAFDRPIISKRLSRGASQNVVAKYQPGGEPLEEGNRMRSRKVVLVAHYDSGKVKPKVLHAIDSTGLPIGLICIGAMALTVFLLLVRIFVGGSGGVATIVLNVLTIIALIIVALPIVKAVLYRMAPYNEGANNNASGVAAIIEVAKRISTGSISEADIAALNEEAILHGEQAALESGYVPEGAKLSYEAEIAAQVDSEFDSYTEEERLLAAKAAIAALTGQPVDSHIYATPEELRSSSEPAPAVEVQVAAGVADAMAPATQTVVAAQQPVAQPAVTVSPLASIAAETKSEDIGGFQNAPSWFVAAQRNAKKPAGEVTQAQRSRYTEAIENAERGAAARERAREEEERIRRDDATRAAIASNRVEDDTPEAMQAAAVIEQAVAQPASPFTEVTDQTPWGDANYYVEPIDDDEAAPDAVVDNSSVTEAADPAPLAVDAEREEHAEMAEEAGQTEQAEQTQETEEPQQAPAIDVPAIEAEQPAEEEPVVDLGSTVAYKPLRLQEESAEEGAPVESTEEDVPAAGTKSRLSGLPSIGSEPEPETSAISENGNPSRSGMFRKLRADVPSLSGIIRMQEAGEDVSQVPPARRSERPAASSLKTAVPQVDEVKSSNDSVDYDMNLGDLADQTIAMPMQDKAIPEPAAEPENHADQNAEAEAGKVDMPNSRADGFFSRRRKRKAKKLDETPQEWLDVDEDFDARTVGRERGGWESFRDENESGEDASAKSSRWQGGAFSRVHLDYVDTRSGDDADSDTPDEMVESDEDRILNEEIGQIIHFRNPQYNTETWFVAIGSDTELHDGAREFINAHRSELRGAMVIEVESLGAGALSVASEEGQFRKTKASSRVKRYTRPATEATGIALDEVKISGSDSITTVIQKAGFQAMHLFGAEDGKPALKGSADDVSENIDELTLEENVNFLMELLKNN